jgi:hypothetical protein
VVPLLYDIDVLEIVDFPSLIAKPTVSCMSFLSLHLSALLFLIDHGLTFYLFSFVPDRYFMV